MLGPLALDLRFGGSGMFRIFGVIYSCSLSGGSARDRLQGLLGFEWGIGGLRIHFLDVYLGFGV